MQAEATIEPAAVTIYARERPLLATICGRVYRPSLVLHGLDRLPNSATAAGCNPIANASSACTHHESIVASQPNTVTDGDNSSRNRTCHFHCEGADAVARNCHPSEWEGGRGALRGGSWDESAFNTGYRFRFTRRGRSAAWPGLPCGCTDKGQPRARLSHSGEPHLCNCPADHLFRQRGFRRRRWLPPSFQLNGCDCD
jgi:hypothetical protein